MHPSITISPKCKYCAFIKGLHQEFKSGILSAEMVLIAQGLLNSYAYRRNRQNLETIPYWAPWRGGGAHTKTEIKTRGKLGKQLKIRPLRETVPRP